MEYRRRGTNASAVATLQFKSCGHPGQLTENAGLQRLAAKNSGEYKTLLAFYMDHLNTLLAAYSRLGAETVNYPENPSRSIGQSTLDVSIRGAREKRSVGVWSKLRRRLLEAAVRLLYGARWIERARGLATESACRAALKQDPRNFHVLATLGRLLMRERRDAEAINIWHQAIALRPGARGPAYQLARALHRSRELLPAAQQYIRVLAIDPGHGKTIAAIEQVCVRLARTLPSRGGDALAAASIGTRLRDLHPDAAWLAGTLKAIAEAVASTAEAAAGRAPDVALPLFEAALELDERLPEALRGTARCLEQLGQPRQALSMWKRMARTHPDAVEPILQVDRLLALQRRETLEGRYGNGDEGGRETMLAGARSLLRRTGDRSAARFAMPLSPEEHDAVLTRARSLLTYPDDRVSLGMSEPLSSEEREDLLWQARVRIGAIGDAGLLSEERRKELLQQARARIASIDNTDRLSAAEREELLRQARMRIASVGAAGLLSEEEREELLQQARTRIAPIGAADPLSEEERAVLLQQARTRITPTGAADLLSEEERAVLLQQAQTRIASIGDVGHLSAEEREELLRQARARIASIGDVGHLSAEEREELLQQARARIAPIGDVSPLSAEEREELLQRARMRIASRGSGSVALAVDRSSPPPEAETIEALLDRAMIAYAARQLDVAQVSLQRILAMDSAEPDALSLLARIFIQRRRWSEARATLMALRTVQPDEAHSVVETELTTSGDEARLWLLMAEIDSASGRQEDVTRAIEHLAFAAEIDLATALGGARLSHKLGHVNEARSLYRRAFAAGPSENLSIEIARFYSSARLVEDAIVSWTALIDLKRVTIEAISQISRLNFSQSRFADLVEFVKSHADPLLREIAARPIAEQNTIMLVVTRYISGAMNSGNHAALRWLIDFLGKANVDGPVAHCLRARLFDSLGEKAAADAELRQAEAIDPRAPAIRVIVQAELCVHAVRYGLYGEAGKAYREIKAEVSMPNSAYGNNFRVLTAIKSHYPGEDVEFYPERLLQEILDDAAARPIGYEPVPLKTMMVVGSLGQGGGEKQTVTVARSLIGLGRVSDLYLAVRSIDRRPADDFFIPVIESSGLEWSVYGLNWQKATYVADCLPELEGRTRLATVINLLPHNLREELVRLSRLILDVRPQAVHIWQDMPVVALACLLCGVPSYFIHRGSLSPDYWQFNDYQWHTHFRPMQFMYRYFVERPGFFFLNNSQIGCQTDANWIGTSRDDRYRVVYNAVQFESLGENLGPNLEMRRQWGIPDSAPVIGGSFRIVPVKRPRLWMETAKLILESVPDAHFVIIGGGDMTDEVVEYAQQHGFAERFHLPGRVADVGAWYRVMDVMLHTSEREGIPNAIIECQHFGVPVVATDVGGIPEALDLGKTGYVIKDATAENYAAHVVEVLSNERWLSEARAAAPQFVHDRFSLMNVLSQLQGFYGWK